jgi:hypothetical protein
MYKFIATFLMLFVKVFALESKIEIGLGLSQGTFNYKSPGGSIVKWRDLTALDFRIGGNFTFENGARLEIKALISDVRNGEVSDDDIENYQVMNAYFGASCGISQNCGVYSKTKSMQGINVDFGAILSYSLQEELRIRIGLKNKTIDLTPKGVYQIFVGIDKDKSQSITTVFDVNNIEIQKLKSSIFGYAIGIEHNINVGRLEFGLISDLFFAYTGKIEFSNWTLTGKSGVFDRFSVSPSVGIDLEIYSKVKYNGFALKYYTYFNSIRFKNLNAKRFEEQDGIVTSTYSNTRFMLNKFGGGVSFIF